MELLPLPLRLLFSGIENWISMADLGTSPAAQVRYGRSTSNCDKRNLTAQLSSARRSLIRSLDSGASAALGGPGGMLVHLQAEGQLVVDVIGGRLGSWCLS